MASGAPGASAAATEHSDTTPLLQLLNQEAGQARALLQSTPFPRTLDIADILELKPMQRSSATHVHATEQDLPTQHDQHEADSDGDQEFEDGKKAAKIMEGVLQRGDKEYQEARQKIIDGLKAQGSLAGQGSPMQRMMEQVMGKGQRKDDKKDLVSDDHEADLTATTTVPYKRMRIAQFPTMRDMQPRGTLHAHENAPGISTTYRLLLYWACSRVVARVHLATVPQRRACRGLRSTWTLQCMTQLCRYDLPACRGCGFYPTSATCSNCCTAWCHSCRAWSALCWKCYRPRHSLADTGEFMPGFGGPGGNGSFDTPL